MTAETPGQARAGQIIRDAVLRAVVVRLLGQRLSTEQVAHALRAEFPA
jgi:hypothetical protein